MADLFPFWISVYKPEPLKPGSTTYMGINPSYAFFLKSVFQSTLPVSATAGVLGIVFSSILVEKFF